MKKAYDHIFSKSPFWLLDCFCNTPQPLLKYSILFFQSVDAALLPTISFPAFSTHEEVLYTETKANIVRRLKGNYGFKRFVRDGFKTTLEKPDKRFYESGEIKVNMKSVFAILNLSIN